MLKRRITIAFAALVLVAVGAPAQDGPAPYLTIHFDTIDPAEMMAWDQNGKDWVTAFSEVEAGKDHYWRAYQSGFTYAWVSDTENFAELDKQGEMEAEIAGKLGEGKMEALMAGGDGAIVDHHSEIWKYQAEMSYMPADFIHTLMACLFVLLWAMIAQFSVCKPKSRVLEREHSC